MCMHIYTCWFERVQIRQRGYRAFIQSNIFIIPLESPPTDNDNDNLHIIRGYSNALENITRLLIGQRRKLATVYSVIYCRKPDVISNVACDWSP